MLRLVGRRVCFGAFLFSHFPGAIAASAESLVFGRAITATQSADERFKYLFEAEAGKTYLIEVDQQGLDFIVSVDDPAGNRHSFNSPLLRDEREFVLIENAAAGTYVIDISCDEYTGAAGRNSVVVNSFLEDPQHVEAYRLMTEGAAANFRAGQEGWSDAISAYLDAATLWRSLGESNAQAQALFSAAMIEYWQMYDWDRTAELTASAKMIYSRLNESALSANVIHLQAAALIEQANEAEISDVPAVFARAMTLFESARQIHQSLGNVYDFAQVTNNVGLTHYYMADFDSAREYWQQAAAVFRNIHEWSAELNPLTNQAVVDIDEGYFESAIIMLKRAMEIIPAERMQALSSRTMDNLAGAYRMNGDMDEALKAYSDARAIHKSIEDKGEAYSVFGLGQTYLAIGDFALAREYLDLALRMLEQTNDQATVEAALRARGNIDYMAGDFQSALEFHDKALNGTAAPITRAQLQVLVTRDLIALKRYTAAEKQGGEARLIAQRENADLILADAELELGQLSLARRESKQAKSLLEGALSVYERLRMRGRQADALHHLARAARQEGNFDSAIASGYGSLERIEALRWNVADPELRALYSATRRGYYDLQISLLMNRHERSENSSQEFLNAALETSERAKARMTIELLAEASVEQQSGLDADYVSQRESLYQNLAAYRYQRDRLLSPAFAADESSNEKLAEILGESARIENEINVLETAIRQGISEDSKTIASRILSARELQAYIDDDSILLQYSIGDEESYVWIVTNESIRSVRLPAGATIDSASLSVVEGVRTHRIGTAQREESAKGLLRLSELILQPVEEMLDRPRILIAADGALEYVPFAVLPLTREPGSTLIDKHDLISVPSISVLVAQGDRTRKAWTANRLLVFADPVFEASDQRVNRRVAAPATLATNDLGLLVRSARAPFELTRLIYTGREAATISGLLPATDSVVMSGFEASRENLLSMQLEDFRYIHFATHGIIDSRYPALSALALSEFKEDGSRMDGLLRLNDIFGLELNADLVVLSACETALGREIRGEGLVGLTQGFLYAGARALVVSLWKVPDRTTGELMARFYESLIKDQLRPAAALRQAQLSIAAERRWNDPYFWGGFVVLGNG